MDRSEVCWTLNDLNVKEKTHCPKHWMVNDDNLHYPTCLCPTISMIYVDLLYVYINFSVLSWWFLLDVISTRLTMSPKINENWPIVSWDSRCDPCPDSTWGFQTATIFAAVENKVTLRSPLMSLQICVWRSCWDTLAWRRTSRQSHQLSLPSDNLT